MCSRRVEEWRAEILAVWEARYEVVPVFWTGGLLPVWWTPR